MWGATYCVHRQRAGGAPAGSCAIHQPAEQSGSAVQSRDLSPAAKTCAGWFRQLARALKTCRLYRSGNPLVDSVRESAVELLLQLVRTHGGWQLRFRPDEIMLGDERVVGATTKSTARDEAIAPPESRLPFLFYRDGIRSLRILRSLPKDEAHAFFDALVTGCNQKVQTDDLVTLLWQANLSHVVVEASPLEQTFYLTEPASAGDEGRASGRGSREQGAVTGAEVRTAAGQSSGPQGLHTFDDWPVVAGSVDVREAFGRLHRTAEAECRTTLDQWTREQDGDWDARVPELFAALVDTDPLEDTR